MKALKAELKSLAKSIRATKHEINENLKNNTGNAYKFQWELPTLRNNFRHKHIAYCLLRGRTMEQIEPKTNNAPDEKLIKEIMDAHTNKATETLCAGA